MSDEYNLIREVVTLPVGSMNHGDRVGVMCDFDGETLRFFGYGKYVGEKTAASVMLDVTDYYQHPLVEYMSREGLNTPEIELDSGETVYGFESWWHKDSVVEKVLDALKGEGVEIETITVAESRRELFERFSQEGEQNE